MTYKQRIVKLLRHFGLDLRRYVPSNSSSARQQLQMQTFNIDLILDVGANTGQYASNTRLAGYRGRIISFEPLSDAYFQLKQACDSDELWEAHQLALGDSKRQSVIHIAGNSTSSSLLNMLDSHINAAPTSSYVGEELVEVDTIDNLAEVLGINGHNIWLKIDTQGLEHEVLKGAENSLGIINTVQLEASLLPLYEGAIGFLDVLEIMQTKGYSLIAIEPGFSDKKTGRLLQADLTFHRYT